MNLTLQTIPSPLISELLASSQFDGVVLDTEHGHFNNETLFSCIQVISLFKKKCFVRVTDFNKQLIRMCLDADVSGIIFSTVEDSVYGDQVLSYCHYPSQGGVRGFGLVRENSWGRINVEGRRPWVIAQIETKKAVDNIHSIISCPFDWFIIGPYDLSASLGCTGQWDNDTYNLYLDKIYNNISLDKLGSFLPKMSDIDFFLNSNKRRPNLVIWGMDTDFILNSIKKIKTT